MIDIYFLEKSFPFNGNDLNSSIIAGSEKTLINIANKLASKKDINVKVFQCSTHVMNYEHSSCQIPMPHK